MFLNTLESITAPTGQHILEENNQFFTNGKNSNNVILTVAC